MGSASVIPCKGVIEGAKRCFGYSSILGSPDGAVRRIGNGMSLCNKALARGMV